MIEREYFLAFGLPVPDEPDENEAGAEPQGAEEPEEAGYQNEDQAETEEEGQSDTETEEAAEGAGKPEKGQSKSENAKYAAARRKAEAERDAAVEKVKAEAQARMDAKIAGMGLKNPYTGKPIMTEAEYDAYCEEHSRQQTEKFKKEHGLSDAEYQKMIEGLPDVQDAKAKAQKLQQQNDEFMRAQYMERLNQEVAKIGAIDPGVKTLDDLVKLPNYEAIYAKVQKGYSLYDAYQTENMDAILGNQQKAAQRQAAINQAGKAHLRTTSANGSGRMEKPVPAGEMNWFRKLCPGMSDAEITNAYNRMMR